MTTTKPPSTIIIARHGIRLDASDKHWSASAEFPYDSPLSYGGWMQCQTLGLRINRELQTLYDPPKTSDGSTPQPQPRKKRKIVIHSSPYLRCIQTSVAIAAGMRNPQSQNTGAGGSVSGRGASNPIQRSSLSNPPMAAADHHPHHPQPASAPVPKDPPKPSRYPLRIDPFLGEWLSTGYFDAKDAPPPAYVLVERSKSALQHPAEEIKGAEIFPSDPIPESPSQEKENVFAAEVAEKGGLRGMAVIGHSLPHRTHNRTTSFGVDMTASNGVRPQILEGVKRRARASSYSPPVPTYSLAPQDPIPPGYFAHARDACVDADMQWDSAAMNWGDGGTYPEEWSTMHIRLRDGLGKMLEFYENEHRFSLLNFGGEADAVVDDEDEEEDLVLILVTHQAGANALIRLLTGAPALHDIGTASLTLAVRRPVLRRQPSISATSHSPLGMGRQSRRGSLDLGLSDSFEMRIIASTEHLRGGSNPLFGINSPRLRQSPAFGSRRPGASESLEGFSIGDPLASYRQSSLGGTVKRSGSQRTYATTDSAPRMSLSSTGLWGSPSIASSTREPITEEIEDLPPVSPKSRPTTPGPVEDDDEDRGRKPEKDRGLSGTLVAQDKDVPALNVESWSSAMNSPPQHPLKTSRTNTFHSSPSTGLWGSTASSAAGSGLWGSTSVSASNSIGPGIPAGSWMSSPVETDESADRLGRGSVGVDAWKERAPSPGKRRWTAVDK